MMKLIHNQSEYVILCGKDAQGSVNFYFFFLTERGIFPYPLAIARFIL